MARRRDRSNDILRLGPMAYPPQPSTKPAVAVQVAVNITIDDMQRHLAPDQIAAVMEGIGLCVAAGVETPSERAVGAPASARSAATRGPHEGV